MLQIWTKIPSFFLKEVILEYHREAFTLIILSLACYTFMKIGPWHNFEVRNPKKKHLNDAQIKRKSQNFENNIFLSEIFGFHTQHLKILNLVPNQFFTRMKALYQDKTSGKNHFGYICACQVMNNSIYSYLETKFYILA